MPGLSDEQIAAARSVDLLSYLQTYEPGSIRKSGAGEYCLAEHDSLKISHGKWFWFSRGFGSNNALDFLVQVRDMDFVAAVNTLAEGRAAPIFPMPAVRSPPESPKKLFLLPLPNRNDHRAIAYLMGRGIDRVVIDICIRGGTLYEDVKRHNCVFVGKDSSGKSRFACLRSTSGDNKKDVPGSDKKFSFAFPAQGESKILNVFESPIDALSFVSMERENSDTWRREHYLSLGGISSRALMQYLSDHPEICDIRLRLDNDRAGLESMARITEELRSHPDYAHIPVITSPSPIGKDWNDLIMHLKQQQSTHQGRPDKEAAISL